MEGKYYHTKASVLEYIRLAKDVSGAELIEKIKEVLPAGSSVLEVGSGPGTDWKILTATYEVVGSDNSKEFIQHLQATHPTGKFAELDATTLEIGQQFDGLYSNKVLHHLTDEELAKSIKRQSEILNPEGIICHSFWSGEGSEFFKDMFVNYHNEDDLKSIFSKQFNVLSINSYAEFEEGDSLLLIGRTK
jgi:SAM-dependent methyltransferase